MVNQKNKPRTYKKLKYRQIQRKNTRNKKLLAKERQQCNQEKGEKNWYEYEQYIYFHYPQDYPVIKSARPTNLLE
ncbi:hypothetical protein I4641_09950 [Waterburya agarophytonicola K14]|uniref:Uncharacterized protein n=1 Tax=Waterburya agarophytonicola KI4 TaxID=2874699 RepID=A0A964FHA3_9CYAN|nr:hypothetical protein [Waterburya agarophytonicola]MCC0177298.1 hypothetical protein [Waterburya agarophytonicola KI4]